MNSLVRSFYKEQLKKIKLFLDNVKFVFQRKPSKTFQTELNYVVFYLNYHPYKDYVMTDIDIGRKYFK